MKLKTTLLCVICALGLIASQTALAQPVITTNVLNDPCIGSDGSLEVTVVSGLTPPLDFTYYTFNGSVINSGVTTLIDTADNLPNCYGVWVTESSNPQVGGYAQAQMNPPFSVDWPNMTLPICPDDQGTIQYTINNGQTPASVSWYEYIAPNTGPFITSSNPATLTTGEPYIAVIEDGSGCSVEQIINGTAGDSIMFEAISDIVVTVSTTPANCTDGTATVDAISGGTGPFTYEWSNAATTLSIDNLTQGSYPVVVTDSEGCVGNGWAWVSQAVNIQVQTDITNATCLENDGAVLAFGAGGMPPYTYEWFNGALGQLNDGLSGGQGHQVLVTDANGCTGQGYGYVGINTPITVTSATTVSSCTSPTGTATLTINGGTPPYTTSWNTFPGQTGVTATGLAVGSYGFTVTDAVGCVRTGAVIIQPESTINASVSAVDAVCPATNGSVSVTASGTNPPFTYLWNNGNTSTSINPAPIGGYSCTITDNVGCSVVKSDAVQSYSPVHVGASTTSTSCLYNCDGSAYAQASGGTAPYTYSWSTGASGQFSNTFCVGYGSVTATDANGCSDYQHVTIGNSATWDDCYCTIRGTVYNDLNNNCMMDAGEEPMQNIMIHCAGFGYAFTNANGEYAFQVPVGSYTVSQNIQAFYPLAACQGNSFDIDVTATSSGCEYIVDFANEINPIHDIHVLTTFYGNPPVPGNPYTVRMIHSNNGTLDEANIINGFEDDGQLSNLTFAPVATTQTNAVDFPNWHSVNSGFPMLEPGESLTQYANYDVPTNIPVATQLVFDDTATSEAPMDTWLLDYTPWNNTNHYTDIVVSSYDPNMVEVLPQGDGPEGFILTADSVLDYIIHFQNTGTYYAQNIVIKMTLDEDVQVETFIPGYSDDDYTVTIDENREVTFTFPDINLPWQAMGEYLSRGMVAFSIKQNPGLSPGTPIEATADIYFDYNAPITTNTALNTIFEPTSTPELEGDFSLLVYPNPSNGLFTIKLPVEAGTANQTLVYDMMGRTVFSSSATTQLDLSDMENGHYLLLVNTENGTYRQKLVVRK